MREYGNDVRYLARNLDRLAANLEYDTVVAANRFAILFEQPNSWPNEVQLESVEVRAGEFVDFEHIAENRIFLTFFGAKVYKIQHALITGE